jgi:hypothetical protein
MSFQQLLADLDAMTESNLAKSDPVDSGNDDAKIEDAAEDGAEAGEAEGAGEGAEADADAGEGDGEGEGEGEQFGKSFKFKLDNGEEVDAFDGTDLVKSLIDQVGALSGRLDGTEGDILKALGTSLDLIKSQGLQIAALGAKVEELGNSGRGRKTVVAVTERLSTEDLAKSQTIDEPAGVTPQEFMAKALTAQAEGKITGGDVARAEGYLQKGLPVPDLIRNRVLS